MSRLLRHYPLDDDAGDARDVASGQHGTVNGASYGGGQFLSESVFRFDDVDDYIDFTGIPSLSEYTVSVWVNHPRTAGGTKARFAHISNNNHFRVSTMGDFDRFRFFHHSPNEGYINLKPPAVFDEWVHLAQTWDSTTVRGYVNGTEIGSAAASATGNPGGNDRIARTGGAISDLRIYDRALTPSEIRLLGSAARHGFQTTGRIRR